ncbi:MAG: NUDIX domain-containing protein [Candidatus Kariarchaeaceae archaeon]|jgi:8-oxo-dGTP pyrophosphatase MutT (NUDIX family)
MKQRIHFVSSYSVSVIHEGTVLWEGLIPMSGVLWDICSETIDELPLELEKRRETVWQEKLKLHPHLYDGDIVSLLHFLAFDDSVVLSVGRIKFSQICTIYYERARLPQFDKSLGVKFVIYNQSKSEFLVGQRQRNSEYKPLCFVLPGGILEVSDLEKPVVEACLREIQEELKIQVDSSTFNLIAIIRDVNELGIQLLTEVIIANDQDPHNLVPNGEWEKDSVHWVTIEDLKQMDEKQILEGLHFVRKL